MLTICSQHMCFFYKYKMMMLESVWWCMMNDDDGDVTMTCEGWSWRRLQQVESYLSWWLANQRTVLSCRGWNQMIHREMSQKRMNSTGKKKFLVRYELWYSISRINVLVYVAWHGSATGGTSDFWFADFLVRRCCTVTLDKLFAPLWICQQAV